MAGIVKNPEYKKLLKQIKTRIQSARIKAAVSVNVELLTLYWDLAKLIVNRQKQSSWGDGLISLISNDLKKEFPDMKGFSPTNLKYMRNWYLFWVPDNTIARQFVSNLDKGKDIANLPQLVGHPAEPLNRPQLVDDLQHDDIPSKISAIFHIPWGHNREIITKCKTVEEVFYVRQTLEHNWSRAVLVHQMESGLIHRKAGAVTNFNTRLPAPQSDLANQTLKDPYCFDFLSLTRKHDEKELEDALMDHLTRFLLELGTGFAFVGRQYRLEIGGDEFFIDLLFYHARLHCYVVVELKAVKFKPEFTGRLNFYVTAVDREIKTESDNPTIGILICKSKNRTVVEYALSTMASPIGVSEYTITRTLPDELKSSLPSIEEIEAELENREGGR